MPSNLAKGSAFAIVTVRFVGAPHETPWLRLRRSMPLPKNGERMRTGWSRCIFLFLVFAVSILRAGQVEPKAATLDWGAYQDETVKMLQEYLRINTSNPPGQELATAEFFHRMFDAASIPNTVYEFTPGRADIYAILKGDGRSRPLILLNHMDVVRADSSDWRHPPFSGEIADGEMYGRGALDMKGEGLQQAMVMLIAAREHVPLTRDLIFLGTADEEVDGLGSVWFIQNHPELVRHAEYLITEGGSNLVRPGQPTLYGVGVAEKAPFWIRVTATGRGGHGSIPHPDSPPIRLIRALCRMGDWQPPIRLLPSVEQYFRALAAIEPPPLAAQFRDIRKALEDPVFTRKMSQDEDFN